MDMAVLDLFSSLRVMTCAHDRTVHLYDVFHDQSIVKLTLPSALQCIVHSNLLDYIVCGSYVGAVYIVDFSQVAYGFSQLQPHQIAVFPDLKKPFVNLATRTAGTTTAANSNSSSNSNNANHPPIAQTVHTISAHQQAITSIVMLPDHFRFVTAALDGTLKCFHLHTQQILFENIPFPHGKLAISNMRLVLRAESTAMNVLKPFIQKIHPLKKYTVTNDPEASKGNGNKVEVLLGPVLLGHESSVAYHQRSLLEKYQYGVPSLQKLASGKYNKRLKNKNTEEVVSERDHGVVTMQTDPTEEEEEEEDYIELPSENPSNLSSVIKNKIQKNIPLPSSSEDFLGFSKEPKEEIEKVEGEVEQQEEENESAEVEEQIIEENDEQQLQEMQINEEKESLHEKIQSLEKDLKRWKKLCLQMKTTIEHLTTNDQGLPSLQDHQAGEEEDDEHSLPEDAEERRIVITKKRKRDKKLRQKRKKMMLESS
jgi:hypothetical protein